MSEELIYVERKNTNCVKWDGLESAFDQSNLLPLWIADMDFMAPLAARQALQRIVEVGVFGYYMVPDGYYDSFISWESRRHGYDIQREWLHYAPGVVPACYWMVKLFTNPGDGVALLTPVYYPFFGAITNTGRSIVRSELVNNGGVYSIDFEDFENKIATQNVKLFILCSPHNPVGRVWEKWELERLCQICQRHGVTIVSDEIHHDLILGPQPHIPTATVGGSKVVTITSASKTFNLAGLQNSFIIIPDEQVRKDFDALMDEVCVSAGSMTGYAAVQAAYEGGEPWLEALINQLRRNYSILSEAVKKIPGAVISPLEGTYLAWIDLNACIPEGVETEKIIQGGCSLAVDYGDWFGGEAYSRFIRINLATCEDNIRLAADRLVEALA